MVGNGNEEHKSQNVTDVASINPVNGYPLVLICQSIQNFDNLQKCLVHIFVDDYFVDIFFVCSLQTATVF